MQLPLDIVLRLINALPSSTEARIDAVEALKRNPESAIAGIVETSDGNLAFDTRRHTVGIYRRKQRRHAEATVELLKKAVAEDRERAMKLRQQVADKITRLKSAAQRPRH